jgi:hypothetical protein
MTEECCECCCEDFSAVLRDRTPVPCGCGFSVCVCCTKTYLLGSTSDPDCMSCHRAVERSFLCDYVGSGWVNGAYKKYQSKVMFDKEMARMASAQPAAKRHLDIAAKDIEILGIKQQIRVMQMKYHAAQSEKWNLKSKTPLVKKQFMQKCGVDGCLGSLSTAWKCGLCDTFSCSSCHAVKGLDRDAPHTCNTDDIASVAEIKKSTRNCPSCSTSIFKIAGCDQMFCTVPGCETPFSFHTGRKETGIIHNPHFFEAQRAGLLAGEGVARAPGDRLCGGIPGVNLIIHLIEKACGPPGTSRWTKSDVEEKLKKQQEAIALGDGEWQDMPEPGAFKHEWSRQIMTTVRGSAHFSAVIVDPLRARLAAATDNEDLRVEFLLKRMDEKKLKSTLARRDKKRQQDQAVLHIMELFSTVLQEELRTIARDTTTLVYQRNRDGGINYNKPPLLHDKFDDVAAEELKHDMESALVKIERVRTYCNEQLLKIAGDFKVMARVIPEDPSTLMRV